MKQIACCSTTADFTSMATETKARQHVQMEDDWEDMGLEDTGIGSPQTSTRGVSLDASTYQQQLKMTSKLGPVDINIAGSLSYLPFSS